MKIKFTRFKWLVTMILFVTAMAMPKMAWAETYDNNGFAEDGSYQPATLTTAQYDINGDGTKDEVYEIGNAGQLYWFAALVNGDTSVDGVTDADQTACAVLTKNITVTNETWTPIGVNGYKGTFDGQGYTISGLIFDNSELNNVGLFGSNSGTIKNVGVVNSYFCGRDNVGGVCGENGGTITGCYNTGEVSGSSSQFVGGVCGSNGGIITGCYNKGTVSGNNQVGGVCGDNQNGGTITSCHNTGSVSGSSDYVGGVCGDNGGTITSCHNTGQVHGYKNYVGGVCGGNSSTISSCYNDNTGAVSGNGDSVGGVCGLNYGGTITSCYNSGSVSGNFDSVGGVCGSNDGGTITGCYNTGSVSGHNQVGGVCGYNSSTITGCYNTGTVSGNSNIGGVCGSNVAENNFTATITNCYYNSEKYTGNAIGTNNGTDSNVEGKTTARFASGEVCYLMNNGITDGTQTWHQNIDMEGATKDPYPVLDNTHGVVYQCSVCTSAYSNTEGAKGAHDYVDDGNGFLTCEACGTKSYQPATLNASSQYEISNAGQLYWFAALVNGELGGETQNTSANAVLTKDITVNSYVLYSDGTLNENYSNFITWTPIGYSGYEGTFDGQGHTISGLYFNKSEVMAVGLFVGNSGTIKNVGVVDSYFYGFDYVGGVCGANSYGGTITGCYNTGTVSGNNQVGGVCGASYGGTITGCYNTGAVSGNDDYVGGVCGYNEGGTITGCYYLANYDDGNGSKTEEQFKSDEVCSLLNDTLKKVNASVRFYQEGENYPELFMNVPSLVGDVYQISNKEELYAFALLVNNGETSPNAVLTADITVNTGVLKENGTLPDDVPGFETWTPIGNGPTPYTGTFDGQGHTISGLYLNDSNHSYVGLFGKNIGTIKNVGVVDSYFMGHYYVGGVCGYNYGTITGCYNTGTVSRSNNYVGGVCGINEAWYENASITNCYNTGTVSGSSNVGGVCGANVAKINFTATITNCYYNSENYTGNAVNNEGGTATKVEGKITEQFKSGEVCYLLNGSSPYGEWGQKIGTNDYPIIGSAYKVLRAAQDGQEGTNYWATFSNMNSNAELRASTGEITVYNATVSGGTLTLTKRNDKKVASGEGVLLKANCEYVNAMNISDEVSAAATTGENHLVATHATEETINAETGYKLYRLTYNKTATKEGLGFYLGIVGESEDGSKLKATPGKAYLKVSTQAATEPSTAKLARGFAFPGDGETTGIECITVTDEGTGNNRVEGIFDLQGRKVSKPTKGVYINNGKKVIIK